MMRANLMAMLPLCEVRLTDILLMEAFGGP